MIHSTAFSFDESSAWDPKVIREQLCIPEDQLNRLSNLPGWFKVTDRANTYRLDKDISTQNFQSSQSNFSATAQISQKDSPVTTQNYQKDSPVTTQKYQKDPSVTIQNCQKDSSVTIQNCQKDIPNFDLFDKHLQFHKSTLKVIKIKTYKKKFSKSISLCEIDKIGENLPNHKLLKRTLSLPVLYQSFDNLFVKSLGQNSDRETFSTEKSIFDAKVLECSGILDQKDTILTKSSHLSKANLEVMEVVSQLPGKIAGDSLNLVDTMNMVSVAHTTKSSDNLGSQSTVIENGVVPVNNSNAIVCEIEHKDKTASELHGNKLDSCVKEIIPTDVSPTIVNERNKIDFISTKSFDSNSTSVLNTESPKTVPNEQSSSAEKIICNSGNLPDAKIEIPKEQKEVPHQENIIEVNKPATEDKCVQGKRKSEFKIKSSKKRKSARDVKPDNGEINGARNIRKAGEICYVDEDILNMINILKHFL